MGLRKEECRQCGKCCMVFEIGPLREHEVQKYKCYEDIYFSGEFHLQKTRPNWAPIWAKAGVCVYLTTEGRCSIYASRPAVCRNYCCRDHNGKLKDNYLQARRQVGNINKWTEYMWEAFGHLLTDGERVQKEESNA